MTISILAAYLITLYAVDDSLDGLFDVLKGFRWLMSKTAQTKAISECPYCFSIYASLLVCWIGGTLTAVNVLGVAGGVCVIFAVRSALGVIEWHVMRDEY